MLKKLLFIALISFLSCHANNIKRIRKLDQHDMGQLIYYLDWLYRDEFSKGSHGKGLPNNSLDPKMLSVKIISIGQRVHKQLNDEVWESLKESRIEYPQFRCKLLAARLRRKILEIKQIYNSKFDKQA
jgi:hypothetical protein